MKLPNLMYDPTFKIIFKHEKTRFFVKEILETIIFQKIELSKIEILDSEIVNEDFQKEKGKVTDCYIKYENYHIFFEANKNYSKNLYELKLRYIHAAYNRSYQIGNRENKNQFILVNINDFPSLTGNCIEKYYYAFENNILTKKIYIMNVYLENIKRKWDNKVTLSKQEKLFLFLKVSHLSCYDNIFEGDEVIMNLREIIKNMSEVEYLNALFDKDEEDAMLLEDLKDTIRETSHKEGLQEGKKEMKIEVAKKMINKKYPKEIILDISGISAKDYDKLINI